MTGFEVPGGIIACPERWIDAEVEEFKARFAAAMATQQAGRATAAPRGSEDDVTTVTATSAGSLRPGMMVRFDGRIMIVNRVDGVTVDLRGLTFRDRLRIGVRRLTRSCQQAWWRIVDFTAGDDR